jgi:hypothetical protein
MDSYTNEKGEVVIIKDMDNFRLVNAIAKYAVLLGKDSEEVKALKAEALRRLAPPTE